MPEDSWRVAGGVDAGGGVEIGVADAAGDKSHQDLAVLGVSKVDFLDHQGFSEPFQDGGANLHNDGD